MSHCQFYASVPEMHRCATMANFSRVGLIKINLNRDGFSILKFAKFLLRFCDESFSRSTVLFSVQFIAIILWVFAICVN